MNRVENEEFFGGRVLNIQPKKAEPKTRLENLCRHIQNARSNHMILINNSRSILVARVMLSDQTCNTKESPDE